MPCYPDTVINLALKEVGYKESANNINKYAETIDKNYPNFYNTKKNGCEWCDIFVDYLFITAYGYDNALKLLCQPTKSLGASCTASYNYYKSKNQVGNSPKLGAQIFFYSKSIGIYHTGIVVDYDYNKVTTVEGNASDGVYKKTYSRTDSKIYGYGYPAYSEVSMKTVHEIALEVINGKWGSGEDRKKRLKAAGYDYNAVQEEVNKILYAKEDKTYAVEIDTKKYDKVIINLK